jgi:hypothetical protein
MKNTMKTTISLILLFTGITTANAFDITVGVPPGGASGRTAIVMQESLQDSHINANINYNSNCAVVKAQIERGEKVVYINTSQGLFDKACHIDINGKNVKLLDELYYYTLALCYRSDRKDLGWDQFNNNAIKKNIASAIIYTDSLRKILDKMKSINNNVVSVGSLGKTREVILGNEFDYVLVDADWVSKNSDKVDCLFIGTEHDITLNGKTFKSLSTYLKTKYGIISFPQLQDAFILIGANLTIEEENNVMAEMTKIRRNPKWYNFVTQFGNAELNKTDKKYEELVEYLKGN